MLHLQQAISNNHAAASPSPFSAAFSGNSSGAGSGGSARSIWGGGAPSNQGSNQWNSNMAPGANNVGRGGPGNFNSFTP